MEELIRGKIKDNFLEEGKRYLDIEVSHLLETKLKGDESVLWRIRIPFDLASLEIDQEVSLHLGVDLPARPVDDTNPAVAIEYCIRQVQNTSPNDRSEKDRWYQIILTDLQKSFADALVYLK